MKSIFTCTIIYFLVSTPCSSQNASVEKQRVPPILSQRQIAYCVNIKFHTSRASGFFYGTSDHRYFLITAKHVFKTKFKSVKTNGKVSIIDSLTYKSGDRIDFAINMSNGWTPISGNIYFSNNPSVDIAVISHNIGIDTTGYVLDEDGVIMGQDCFFLGYPLGFTNAPSAEFNGLKVPIIKKGIVSGSSTSDSAMQWLLDGNNTFGLSGGPVLFFDYREQRWKVLGVISGFYPQTNISYDDQGKQVKTTENSGIFIAYPIRYAKEIISKIK